MGVPPFSRSIIMLIMYIMLNNASLDYEGRRRLVPITPEQAAALPSLSIYPLLSSRLTDRSTMPLGKLGNTAHPAGRFANFDCEID